MPREYKAMLTPDPSLPPLNVQAGDLPDVPDLLIWVWRGDPEEPAGNLLLLPEEARALAEALTEAADAVEVDEDDQ